MRWLSQGEAQVPNDDLAWLSATERQRLATMRYTKRRVEYLLGRWTAKLAVAAVEGLPAEPSALAAVEITPAVDGAPVASLHGQALPRRVSLTDRAGWAVCTVSPSGLEVGCDLELVEHRTPSFVADYFTPAEQALVHACAVGAGLAAADQPHLVGEGERVKVLRTGLRRDTRSVEVTLGDGLRRGLGAADRQERRGLHVPWLVATVRHLHLDRGRAGPPGPTGGAGAIPGPGQRHSAPLLAGPTPMVMPPSASTAGQRWRSSSRCMPRSSASIR